MKGCIRFIISIIFLFSLSACQTNNFKDFYNDERVNMSDYIPLNSSQVPVLMEVDDVTTSLEKYKANGYVILGSSSIRGPWEPRCHLIDLAKEKKATLIIAKSEYLKTVTHNYQVTIPTTNTSYVSGSVYTPSNTVYYNGTISSTSYNTYHGSYESYIFNQTAYLLAPKR